MDLKIYQWSLVIVDFVWGNVLWLVLGAGVFFTLYCRWVPFCYLWHGIQILSGKYDNNNEPGQLSHFKALSTALASTVGMGNLAGVAVAIQLGGPGALFWMWVTAILGMSTKFFTCTLAVLFREKDSDGQVHGGPMYVITQGLSKKWHGLAYLFSIAGCIGCLPLFQVNQLTALLNNHIMKIGMTNMSLNSWVIGIIIAILTWAVMRGGLTRIAAFTSTLVPFMVVLYIGVASIIIIKNITIIPSMMYAIFHTAFVPTSMLGGGVGMVMLQGIKRGAYSNEAGIGTEALAHGTAKTTEPVREGLVAMLGPLIDTLIICTLTGLIILCAGEWTDKTLSGINLTSHSIISQGGVILGGLFFVCVCAFSFSTLVGYSFYSFKCITFLFGKKAKTYFLPLYLGMLIISSIISLDLVINIVDSAFGIMAVPTLISTLLLSPKVMKEAKRYFEKLNKER